MSSIPRRHCRHSLLVALALAAVVAGPEGLAQQAGNADSAADALESARRGVAALGKHWDAQAFADTVRLYTAVHREVEWPGVLEPAAVRYGSDAQQTLRVFRPEQGFSEPGPVVVFLHGNGLGEESDVAPGSDGLIYSHIGKLGAAFGGIGVTVNYRTGAAATADSGATDLRLALEWIQGNVASYGGDVNTIVLLANSEGANIAANYLFDEDAQLEAGPGIAVAVLISGLFGDAAPRLHRLIDRYEGSRVPLALWSAGYDPGRVQAGIAELYAALCRKYEECPWFEQLHGHNHVSHILSLGTDDTSVQNALIRFYHTQR